MKKGVGCGVQLLERMERLCGEEALLPSIGIFEGEAGIVFGL
jgi:hypothetical protein